ncbi:MAG: M56 family metallopeptidase [Deltaproteobacteria bacterium]
MPADFLPAGMFALSWGTMYLVHSTALLAGAWLFLKCHRRAGHGLRETLWKTALVGSIVTASVEMLPLPRGPFGDVTFSLADVRTPAPAASAAPLDLAAMAKADGLEASFCGTYPVAERDSIREGGEIVWVPADDRAAESPASHDETAFAAGPRLATSPQGAFVGRMGPFLARTLPVMIVAIALAAVLLGIARCFWQTWSLRRKLAHCSEIDSGPVRRLLDDLRCLVPHAPEVRLLSAPEDPEPAAFGIHRWTIVLPARAVHDLSEDELRALLAHELAHLVRGDSLWLLISRVICSCLAFQPLNHLARREWQRAAEYLCDSWAVSRTGTPLALARCLAEVAGWRLSGQPSAALLAATGRESGLADRIERLLESADLSETWNELRQRRRWLLAAGILLGLFTWYAPRLQLAVAGPDNAQRTATDPGQRAGAVQDFADEGDDGQRITDAAKPQASGEGGAVAGEDFRATTSDIRAPTGADGPDAPASDLRTLLSSLDRDLSALEGELRQLESLLAKEDAPAAVARLAGRLRQEIVQLKRRRDALRTEWKKNLFLAFPQK